MCVPDALGNEVHRRRLGKSVPEEGADRVQGDFVAESNFQSLFGGVLGY